MSMKVNFTRFPVGGIPISGPGEVVRLGGQLEDARASRIGKAEFGLVAIAFV